MRRAAILVVLLAGCGRRDPGTACPHDPGFDRSGIVAVSADVRPATLRRDLDLEELAAESHGLTGAGKPQGLTQVEHQLNFETFVDAKTTRGRLCVWLDWVRVDLTPKSVHIFVPREYHEDSCESQAVLAHEREHERVHRERLEAAARRIEEALTAAKWLPARGNPMESGDRRDAETAINAKVKAIVAPLFEDYRVELAAAQAELDKPALYQWVAKRCAGWK